MDEFTRRRAIQLIDQDAEEAIEEMGDEGTAEIRVKFDHDEPVPDDVDEMDESQVALHSFEREADSESVEVEDDVLSAAYRIESVVPKTDEEVRDEKNAHETSQRLELIHEMNKRLESGDHNRRYATSKSDAPDGSLVLKDAIGHYYYETGKHRPTDLFGKIENYRKLEDGQKVVKTVAALVEIYPMFMDDVAGTEHAEEMVDSVLVDQRDTADRYDRFETDVVESVGQELMEYGKKNQNDDKT